MVAAMLVSENTTEPLTFEIFPWNHNFETGIEVIDSQHKKLVEILNRLAWHFASSHSDVSCDHVLDELLEYAKFHFAEEEQIWNSRLPEQTVVSNHQECHQLFVETIRQYQASQSDDEEVLADLFDYLTRWLAFHILESDRRMALMVSAVSSGMSPDQARRHADEQLGGPVAVLVSALLEIYNKLAGSTIQLMREKMARKRAEEELEKVRQARLDEALEQQASEYRQQLEFLAYYDSVTGLENRNGIVRQINTLLESARLPCGSAALISLDLDNFLEVNTRFGEESADRFLGILARRWLDALFPGGALARVSGDEFVVLVRDSAQVQTQLDALQLTAGQPCSINGSTVSVQFSAGVVLFPHEGINDADTLLRQADHTLFRAKQEARGSWLFMDAEEQLQYKARQQLFDEIRKGLPDNQFRLYYQPKVNMCTGELIGVEALIRWQHPERGLLAPGHFLPAVEHHPVIMDIGEWVIREALTQLQRWDREDIELSVGVNIAALHLRHSSFVERLANLLDEFPEVAPQRLDLEILETAALGELDKATETIQRCTALGVSFSLDDFGTGYSSLSYLKNLPVDTLKIDQGFVRDSLDNGSDISILKGIISLSQAFNHCVIAEGVETLEHGNLLISLGCCYAQGYAIARPMPADALPEWQQSWVPPAPWYDPSCQT